jgi:uncharacterized protein HemX
MNKVKSLNVPCCLALLLVALLSLGGVSGAVAQTSGGGIREAMTPQQFKEAGLEKLTPDELAKLDAFLKGDREQAVAKATEKATKREKLQLVVSRVDGVITEIKPRQIIRFEDGSTWKVARTDFQFHGRVDHPAAAAFKNIFGWKMRIANVAEIYVVPVGR